MDFIPDAIPLIGFLDDLAVLTTVINSLQAELLKYRKKIEIQLAIHQKKIIFL